MICLPPIHSYMKRRLSMFFTDTFTIGWFPGNIPYSAWFFLQWNIYIYILYINVTWNCWFIAQMVGARNTRSKLYPFCAVVLLGAVWRRFTIPGVRLIKCFGLSPIHVGIAKVGVVFVWCWVWRTWTIQCLRSWNSYQWGIFKPNLKTFFLGPGLSSSSNFEWLYFPAVPQKSLPLPICHCETRKNSLFKLRWLEFDYNVYKCFESPGHFKKKHQNVGNKSIFWEVRSPLGNIGAIHFHPFPSVVELSLSAQALVGL